LFMYCVLIFGIKTKLLNHFQIFMDYPQNEKYDEQINTCLASIVVLGIF